MIQFGHNDNAPAPRSRICEEFEEREDPATREKGRCTPGVVPHGNRRDAREGATPVVCSLIRKIWARGKIARTSGSHAMGAATSPGPRVSPLSISTKSSPPLRRTRTRKGKPFFADETRSHQRHGAEFNAACVIEGLRACRKIPSPLPAPAPSRRNRIRRTALRAATSSAQASLRRASQPRRASQRNHLYACNVTNSNARVGQRARARQFAFRWAEARASALAYVENRRETVRKRSTLAHCDSRGPGSRPRGAHGRGSGV